MQRPNRTTLKNNNLIELERIVMDGYELKKHEIRKFIDDIIPYLPSGIREAKENANRAKIKNERQAVIDANKADLERKNDLVMLCSTYRDGTNGAKSGFGVPSVERILTITPYSGDKVYFEFKSTIDDNIVCDTGKKVASMQPNSFGRQLLYEEDDCSIKINFSKNNNGFEYFNVSGMQYQGTCQKYCNESFVSNSFISGKGNLFPSVQHIMRNIDAEIKMDKLAEKKKKDSWN